MFFDRSTYASGSALETSSPRGRCLGLAFAIFATLLGETAAQAANHSDAPLIKLDPQVNLTDVYTFVGEKSGSSERVLNVVVQVRPFSEPGDGAIYDRFSPDARYSINITDPATGVLIRRYDFEYSAVTSGYKRKNTILSYGQALNVLGVNGEILDVADQNQNFTQTYTLTRVDIDKKQKEKSRVLGTGLTTPPPNVGNRVTPLYNDLTGRARSGAVSFEDLDRYTQQTIHDLPTGETVWSGHREDGFYADIPGVFNLLDPRILVPPGVGNPEGQSIPGFPAPVGTDGFRGFNVLVFAIQIPLADLPSLPYSVVTPPPSLLGPLRPSYFGPPTQKGVGVYASTFRPHITLAFDETDGKQSSGSSDPDTRYQQAKGGWVQVQRLGNPIFNEGAVALQDKDNLNRTSPPGDERYATYALNSEIATTINTIYGTSALDGVLFQDKNRTDLKRIFIPEVLRVNTETEPVRLAGQLGFSRLGSFGGDHTANGTPSGWPNGRRLGDDVTDILLTLIASGPSYQLVVPVGDAVPANDQLFHQVFPYAATPNSGVRNSKDSGENIAQ